MKAFVYRERGLLFRRDQWRCRIKAQNGEITFVSAEGYNNQADLVRQIRKLNPDLPIFVVETGGARQLPPLRDGG